MVKTNTLPIESRHCRDVVRIANDEEQHTRYKMNLESTKKRHAVEDMRNVWGNSYGAEKSRAAVILFLSSVRGEVSRDLSCEETSKQSADVVRNSPCCATRGKSNEHVKTSKDWECIRIRLKHYEFGNQGNGWISDSVLTSGV